MCDCGRVVTGPNTVVMPETGNGHNCDCNAPQFLIGLYTASADDETNIRK